MMENEVEMMEREIAEAEGEDSLFIRYLYVDDLTGEKRHTSVPRKYAEAVELLKYGRHNAEPVSKILDEMGEEDTDSNRRKWRAAVEYILFWRDNDHDIFPCSTTSGYYIAKTRDEVEACLQNKEKAAKALLDRVTEIREKAIKYFEKKP
jgi:hypothetical protein